MKRARGNRESANGTKPGTTPRGRRPATSIRFGTTESWRR
jgi:hypothetical protein